MRLVSASPGSNALRGSAFEFFRNEALNARNYFASTNPVKPQFRRSQFGGVLGGPIRRNQTFFFADYEGFRQKRQTVAFGTIPTASQRGGVLTVPVRNPLTGAVYEAGTPIPMTTFAARVLRDIPDPTRAGTANNYETLQNFTNDNNKYSGKLDYQVSPALRAFARFG
mgnify:CR=1 FL=1